jgi:transposase
MEPRDATFFTNPVFPWQRRYEAVRALVVERQPARIVAERFGYRLSYVYLLRHLFKTGRLDFAEPVPEGKAQRHRVSAEVRRKIRAWREKRLSAGEIAQLLSEDGMEISVRTVERVLAEEGFPRLPRRTRLKIGLTVKGTEVPERSETVTADRVRGQAFDSPAAGVFLFAPFLAQLDIAAIVREAALPGTRHIPALSYFLSFLAAKLLGTERYAHIGDHAFDPGLGLFAGLNVLPKCTAMSTYSYSLDDAHVMRLQQAFVRCASTLGLYDGQCVNLDFHTIPHYGDESVLETHWAGAHGKCMKGALTLFAQDAESKLILYTAADILRREADDQVIEFLAFWQKTGRGLSPRFLFDSKFTSYKQLAELDTAGVKFITLRRRGAALLASVTRLGPWRRITIPHQKRKYPHVEVHDSIIALSRYGGDIRQIVMRGNGREQPTFLITNDFELPVELAVGHYARRARVENGIAEGVKFFNLNALSSPILVKVHFDVALTMIADTLYTMLARRLRRFELCDAPKLYRTFVRGKGTVAVNKHGALTVTYPRRAGNPVLRAVAWDRLPLTLPGLAHTPLTLQFR